MCDKVMYKGKVVDKESTWEIKFEKIISLYGERGERVLAFAKLNLPKDVILMLLCNPRIFNIL